MFITLSLLMVSLLGNPETASDPLIEWLDQPVRILSLFSKGERPLPPGTKPSLNYGINLAFLRHPHLKERIEWKEVQTSRKVSELVLEAQENIESFKPDLIIGGSTSNMAFVISEIAEKKKIPFLTPWATHPSLTKNKHYTFRTCFDDYDQAAKLAQFIVSVQKLKNGVIFINSKETFSVGFKDIFIKKAYESGAQKIIEVNFSDEKEIDSKVIESLKNKKIDFVLIPSYDVEAGAILSKLIGSLPKKIRYFGPDSWGSSQVVKSVLSSMGFETEAYVVNHWSKLHESSANAAFLKLYQNSADKQMIEQDPNINLTTIAVGFDLMSVVLEALKVKDKYKWDILSALKEVTWEGVTGTITPGDPKKQSLSLFIYKVDPKNDKFIRAYR